MNNLITNYANAILERRNVTTYEMKSKIMQWFLLLINL